MYAVHEIPPTCTWSYTDAHWPGPPKRIILECAIQHSYCILAHTPLIITIKQTTFARSVRHIPCTGNDNHGSNIRTSQGGTQLAITLYWYYVRRHTANISVGSKMAHADYVGLDSQILITWWELFKVEIYRVLRRDCCTFITRRQTNRRY